MYPVLGGVYVTQHQWTMGWEERHNFTTTASEKEQKLRSDRCKMVLATSVHRSCAHTSTMGQKGATVTEWKTERQSWLFFFIIHVSFCPPSTLLRHLRPFSRLSAAPTRTTMHTYPCLLHLFTYIHAYLMGSDSHMSENTSFFFLLSLGHHD